ncbi:MAG: hypothetical protein LLG04_12590 [Parachlamydia sp.]|nr:hypothetical protein [Parachlamydia sp.]
MNGITFMLDLAATPAIHYQSLCLFASLAERDLLHDPKFPQLITGALERTNFKSVHPIHCTKLTLLKAISTLHHRVILHQPSPEALQAVKTLIRDPQTGWLYPFAQEDLEMLTQLISAWNLAKKEPVLEALCDPKVSYESLTFHPSKRPLGKLL